MKEIEKYVERKKSIITKEEDLEELYSFIKFPVFFGCTDQNQNDDLHLDMTWAIDRKTGIIQLTKLVPLEILYMAQHVDATGSTWEKYNNEFSKYVISNKSGNIIEIGGGSGKIAKIILSIDNKSKYTIIEPNPLVESEGNLEVIKSFFSENTLKEIGEEKTIIFSQLFEHVYDPEDFLKTINKSLKIGEKLIFAYPNLEYWFSNKFTNAINFEHTCLMTDFYVDYFIKKTGFEIIEKIDYEKHSHFYTVIKKTDPLNFLSVENKYLHYRKMFLDFIEYHKKMVKEINEEMSKSDSSFFLFGGHIFSQYLIMFGLNCDKIEFILDNSPLKQEKRLYGTNLIVKSPKILSNYKKATVILKAGLYDKEIKDDILNNINDKVSFI